MSGPSNFEEQLRTSVKGIHGAGEAIRGTMMQAVDEAFDTKKSTAKDQAIVEKGRQDMKRADEMIGREHGIQGGKTAEATSTTGAGVHSGAPGNVGTTGAMTEADLNKPQEKTGVNQRF